MRLPSAPCILKRYLADKGASPLCWKKIKPCACGWHSLTIFRGLLEDPVVSRLAALLHAQPSDAEACADAYCAFAAALYERGGDLSTYLLKAVLEDENLYVRRAASGASIPAELAECLQHELCFLQELSKFDGAALRGALKGSISAPLGHANAGFRRAL